MHQSILFAKRFLRRMMDPRVKPAGDGEKPRSIPFVMPGLDPGIHRKRSASIRRGWIGPRVKPGEIKPGNDDGKSAERASSTGGGLFDRSLVEGPVLDAAVAQRQSNRFVSDGLTVRIRPAAPADFAPSHGLARSAAA